MEKKPSSLMNKECDNELAFCDNDKYIKTKIKSYGNKIIQIFIGKNTKRKYVLQIFIIDNVKFCC